MSDTNGVPGGYRQGAILLHCSTCNNELVCGNVLPIFFQDRSLYGTGAGLIFWGMCGSCGARLGVVAPCPISEEFVKLLCSKAKGTQQTGKFLQISNRDEALLKSLGIVPL